MLIGVNMLGAVATQHIREEYSEEDDYGDPLGDESELENTQILHS